MERVEVTVDPSTHEPPQSTRLRRFVRGKNGTATPHRSRTTLLAAVMLLAGGVGCSSDSDTLEPSTTAATSGQERQAQDRASSTVESSAPPSDAGRSDQRQAEHREVDTSDVSVEPTEDDVSGLRWMREEEQLAHDVYSALGEQWNLRVFDNIAASERRHVDEVTTLLDRFDIDDPLTGRPPGTFSIPEMQERYDELTVSGGQSLIAALSAGASIEEIDIADLRARTTDVTEIQRAYDRLEAGSRRHLRAFVDQLEARGVVYEPVHLDAELFEQIVSGGEGR